jgi:dihydroxy-acid dehydratase
MPSLNKYSSKITQPKSQGASQAMLFGTGMTADDMNKAQVGIASVWYEGNTCNMHLNGLADKVKQGVQAAGLVGMRFNTIGVSDGISMGTDGMSFSLQSREIIADSIETVMSAQWYDANISIPGCDKNMPGCMIAMGRLNRPSLMIYGGTIRAGSSEGQKLDVVSAFQSYGEYLCGRIGDDRRMEIVRHACPGAGACGGMYTANTMASAIEGAPVPGISLAGSMSLSTSSSRSSMRSSSPSELPSLVVPNGAKPVQPSCISQSQWAMNRSVSGPPSSPKGVSTGAMTPEKPFLSAMSLSLALPECVRSQAGIGMPGCWTGT